MNYEIIIFNIQEAREQLEEIENLLKDNILSEIDFQSKLEHTYHHLNFAWNIRHKSTDEYENMSDGNFNKWNQFPREFNPYKLK